MFERLIETVDPIKAAKAGKSLSGEVFINQMPRLSELLADNGGSARAHLQFGQIENGSYFVTGEIKAVVKLICQRCMEEMSLDVITDLSLIFVEPGQNIDDIPEEFEPRVIEEQMLNLPELLEDELILAMPIVAMHEESECNSDCLKYCTSSAVEPEKISDTQTHRPLAGLKEMLDKHSR